MTRHRLPQVADEWLTVPAPLNGTEVRLRLGSAEWHAWLDGEGNTSFSFAGDGTTVTMRRERQRNGWFWYAYHKHEGRLRKAYLGKSEELTADRLRLVARTLGSDHAGSPPDAPLQLRLLGLPSFARNDQPLTPPTAKAIALLAYLAVMGTPQARESILALLWPESAPLAARKNLRNTLWSIRATLGAEVLRDGARLALGQAVQVDVQTFEQGFARNSAQDQQQALALFCGPFLEGLVVDDAPEFELWLTTQRERLDLAYLRAAGAHIARSGGQGDWQQVLAVAHTALSHDSVQESFWQALMEAHARLGQRAEALRAFETLRATLERELGIEPLPATVTLRDAIARGDLTPATPDDLTPGTPGDVSDTASACPMEQRVRPIVLRGPFVGRDRPLSTLDAALALARHGQARAVLLTGEAGIGKTRLWQEWSTRLAADVRVMETRCLEVTQPMPYAPLLAFFDQARVERFVPGGLPDIPAWLAEIARLIPAAPGALSRQAVPEPHTMVDQRHRVFEAFVQCFRALCGHSLVVCIDDAQWADGATLDCLGYVADRLHDCPFVLVLAYQPAEAPAALVRLGAGWCRQKLVHHLELSPLGVGEVAALVDAYGGDPTRVASLHTLSGGNPLLIAELLHAAPGDVPPILTGLIGARLNRLPEDALRLLQAAAILEPDSEFAALWLTVGRGEEETLDALDLLLQASILIEREQVYAFSIPLIAEVVRLGISGARRLTLHRRAAAAIEALHGDQNPMVAGRLARHCSEAGDKPRAAYYAERAAEHASTLAAWDEAAAFYRQSITLEPNAARQLGLGKALFHAGDVAAARSAFDAARALYDACGERGAAGGAALALAETYVGVGESTLVRYWAEVARSYLDDQSDPADRALAHVLMGMSRAIGGQELAAAESDLATAARLATASRLDELAARSFLLLGNVRAERGNIADALQAYRAAIVRARNGGVELLEALAHNNLAYHALLAGELPTAHAHVAAGQALATQRRLQPVLQFLYSTHGAIALAEERWQEAGDWFNQALGEAERYGNTLQVANLHAQLGRVAQGCGDRDGAVIELEAARTAAAGLPAQHLQAQIDLWLATLYLERGERKAAAVAVLCAERQLAGSERAGLQAWAATLRERLAVRVA